MKANKINIKSYHHSLAVIGLGITFVGSQLIKKEIYPYVLFPVIVLMLVSQFFKIRKEISDGIFDKSKYISAGLAILFSIGILIYFLFFGI